VWVRLIPRVDLSQKDDNKKAKAFAKIPQKINYHPPKDKNGKTTTIEHHLLQKRVVQRNG
jgi:hypothetical protein